MDFGHASLNPLEFSLWQCHVRAAGHFGSGRASDHKAVLLRFQRKRPRRNKPPPQPGQPQRPIPQWLFEHFGISMSNHAMQVLFRMLIGVLVISPFLQVQHKRRSALYKMRRKFVQLNFLTPKQRHLATDNARVLQALTRFAKAIDNRLLVVIDASQHERNSGSLWIKAFQASVQFGLGWYRGPSNVVRNVSGFPPNVCFATTPHF